MPALEEIDFEPERPSRVLLGAFGLVYGLGLGFGLMSEVTYQLGRDPLPPSAIAHVAGIVGLYLLGPVLVLCWERGARRFRFREDGVQVLTWRGRRFVPWRSVTKATLYHWRQLDPLDLWTGRLQVLVVPLYGWRRRARLLEEIRARLPVEIRGRRAIDDAGG